ncbi:hypothetical protein GCM10022221_31590 [Actinocorallia aurea]
MNVEDRLRAALRGTADLVEDRPRPLPAARRRIGRRFVVPAWSALAAAVVMLTPSALPDHPGGPGGPDAVASADGGIGAAPQFFVAIYPATEFREARWESRRTASGEVLGGAPAGPGEMYVSVTGVPEHRAAAARSFLLLTRTGEGSRPGCARYRVYAIHLDDDGRFLSWNPEDVDFEAADGAPAHLATTAKGDEIAYSYRECGVPGGQRIAHHWNGTTTTWDAGGSVLSLAYTPDGQGVVVFQRGDDGGELLVSRTYDPSDTTVLLREHAKALGDHAGDLLSAGLTPDGERITAVLGAPAGGVSVLRVAELRKNGDLLGVTYREPAVETPRDGAVQVDQHRGGPELLVQAGGTILLPGSVSKAVVLDDPPPTDLAW